MVAPNQSLNAAVRAIGNIIIGGAAAGYLPSAPLHVGAPPPMGRQDTRQAHALGYRPQTERAAAGLDDDGRSSNNGQALHLLVTRARHLGKGMPTSVTVAPIRPTEFIAAMGLTPAGRLALLTRPGTATADFELLADRRPAHTQLVAQLLGSCVPCGIIDALDEVLCGRSVMWPWPDDATRLRAGSRVFRAILVHGHPVPQRSDFLLPPPGGSVAVRAAPGTVPDVDCVYFVAPSLPAYAALREGERVFAHRCTLSLLSHRPLDLGYMIPLADQQGMARVLASENHGSEAVPAGYVGRERVSSAAQRFGRPRHHFVPDGCPALSEVAHCRRLREGGYVHTPLLRDGESPLAVHRRILALLPQCTTAKHVDLLETVLMYLLARAGLALYNGTPGPGPTSGGGRYFEATSTHGALLDEALEALHSAAGPAALASRAPADFVQAPFLRRALLTGALLVDSGIYYREGANFTLSAASQLFSMDALISRGGRPVQRIQLAFNACSVGCPQLLCFHIMWGRMWFEAETGGAWPAIDADGLLYTTARGGRAATASQRYRIAASSLPPAVRPAEAAASAGMHATAALLLLPHVSERDMGALATAAARLAVDVASSAQRACFGSGLSYGSAARALRGGLRSQAEIAAETARQRVVLEEFPRGAVDMLAFALRFSASLSLLPHTAAVLPNVAAPTYPGAVSHAAQLRLPDAMTTLLVRAAGGTVAGYGDHNTPASLSAGASAGAHAMDVPLSAPASVSMSAGALGVLLCVPQDGHMSASQGIGAITAASAPIVSGDSADHLCHGGKSTAHAGLPASTSPAVPATTAASLRTAASFPGPPSSGATPSYSLVPSLLRSDSAATAQGESLAQSDALPLPSPSLGGTVALFAVSGSDAAQVNVLPASKRRRTADLAAGGAVPLPPPPTILKAPAPQRLALPSPPAQPTGPPMFRAATTSAGTTAAASDGCTHLPAQDMNEGFIEDADCLSCLKSVRDDRLYHCFNLQCEGKWCETCMSKPMTDGSRACPSCRVTISLDASQRKKIREGNANLPEGFAHRV